MAGIKFNAEKIIRRVLTKRNNCLFLFVLFCTVQIFAESESSYITTEKSESTFTISESDISAPIVVSSSDFPGVLRALKLFQKDIENVTGAKPLINENNIPNKKEIIIVGTIGKSNLIDKLIENEKLDVSLIAGKWESFIIQAINNPFPNVEKALVIVGSDKRGTIFGTFDLSDEIGVSPWYWWADVPVKKRENIYVLPGVHTKGEPKVKYRGIFINDEAPALSGWSNKRYGTVQFNHELYDHVFELILRLKGNFLWPAMWGRAFYDDDSLSPKLADEYGIVISTSHHEPMMRAHVEWQRYGSGPWNYDENAEELRAFWREGIERMGTNESIVTLAMRGDGDESMSPTANVSLLQKVVEDQRKILTEVTGKNAEEIPQVWALYKEVQEYYDKGMRVPDDVTLLLCDDNWGNIRKLPKLSDAPRKGGYGIYYHYDFVGGPRNYKWLNTTQIERVWEQMNLAYEYDANEIWIVNVGDLKPMEFPIEFFLDYAWDPGLITANNLYGYYKTWTEEQFGNKNVDEIAEILSKYTKFNSRRKPELLSPETYSLVNYKEAETIVYDYNELYVKAKSIYNSLPDEYKDSFYQLVLHPVEACSNLNELYVTVAKNRLYAKQGRNLTNKLADDARNLYKKDSEITHYYNEVMAGGKWDHMMDQTHIGYTSWQQPDENTMPEVTEIDIPKNAEMGIAVEGSTDFWSVGETAAMLPEFDSFNKQSYYIEVFNRGKSSFKYEVKLSENWIKVSPKYGEVDEEKRLWVSMDWSNVPVGKNEVSISVIDQENKTINVNAIVNNIEYPLDKIENCFIESNGYISIESVNYTRSFASPQLYWETIPNLGRTSSAITLKPVTANNLKTDETGARLEYQLYFTNEGEVEVKVYLSPTLNYGYKEGLRYAISIDDEKPQIINMHEGDTPDWKYPQYWNQAVANNIRIKTSKHLLTKPGKHVLKYWVVDSGIILQKIVIESKEINESYLGPPQSFNSNLMKNNLSD